MDKLVTYFRKRDVDRNSYRIVEIHALFLSSIDRPIGSVNRNRYNVIHDFVIVERKEEDLKGKRNVTILRFHGRWRCVARTVLPRDVAR